MENIFGYLERITYYNEESHFMIGKLKEKAKRELTPIIGSLPGVQPGETLKLSGNWQHHKKFGLQFHVVSFESIAPTSSKGMERYLASGFIKGVGEVMAKRIVKKFGSETLDIIENRPDQLLEVEGIGSKRLKMIINSWEAQSGIKEIMIFLQDKGVSAAYATKIYRQYEKDAIKVLEKNPYQLAADIRGIGFITADRIAREMGIDVNSELRAKEGVIYTLQQLMEEGHVYFPRQDLLKKAQEILEIEESILDSALESLVKDRRIIIDDSHDCVLEEKPVYLAAYHIAERNSAKLLINLLNSPKKVREVDVPKAISWAEEKVAIKLAEKQREAVASILKEKIVVITGGPGTGKTTIIKAIARIFKALKVRLMMAAPTGRAAKRMQEATGYDAKTIHRLLEYSPREGGFKKNQDEPLEVDVLIIDETSMIDTMLMYQLLRAIPQTAKLILVGDINQLPSVGPGNVLREIIQSEEFAVIELNEIFRQSRKSKIILNAHRINQGEYPYINKPKPGEKTDFYFIEEDDPEKLLLKISNMCYKHIPEQFKFDPLRDIQVLTPMHKGIVGVANLNVELQKVLNPENKEILRGGRIFRIQDKVMQMVNNYDKDVYNGDLGWIKEIDTEEQVLKVDFDDRMIAYDFAELDEIQLAYACSIHKSQGSEYPVVVMPLLTQHYMLLQRNLLYTGVTRAKKLVILMGSKRALGMAISNNKIKKRYTLLKEKILEYSIIKP